MARTAPYDAANAVLSRVTRFSALKRWGMDVAKRRGTKRATVALARKLGVVVLHRMWMEGTSFPAVRRRPQRRRKSRAPDRMERVFEAVLTRAASSEVPFTGFTREARHRICLVACLRKIYHGCHGRGPNHRECPPEKTGDAMHPPLHRILTRCHEQFAAIIRRGRRLHPRTAKADPRISA